MKTTVLLVLSRAACVLAVCGLSLAARAAERVGVYDSRLVAYACFNTPDHLAALRTLMADAKAAKERGDTTHFRALERQIKDEQKRAHLQIFSTAPAPEALAQLGPRVEAVQREAGVARLVSKWDDKALGSVPAADRVDVTDALVRDVPLSEKQRTTLRELAAKKPLPLWQAKLLVLVGKL